jgi:hypothetical protein
VCSAPGGGAVAPARPGPTAARKPKGQGVVVDALVVDDQVHVQILEYGLLDLPEEPQELLVPVAGLALGDHLAGGDIQGGEQRGSAVPDVVMPDALHVAQAHGQQRLGAIQGLDLRLLVDAEHHRLVGRVQVQTNDVADLLDKEGISGELVAIKVPRSGSASALAALLITCQTGIRRFPWNWLSIRRGSVFWLPHSFGEAFGYLCHESNVHHEH